MAETTGADAQLSFSMASMALSALGRTRARRKFSMIQSTEENNKSDDMEFYGPFAHIRATLDYTYHSNYRKERQFLQDSILREFLDAVRMTDLEGNVGTTPERPWIVFTAGGMGAGKGYTIDKLVSWGYFPVAGFVGVDPDEIRRRLPEFRTLAKLYPKRAGELTRKEAGYVSEILAAVALEAGKNVLVDGSLRDSDWYQKYFGQLREEYPMLQIAILHIKAPREAVFERADERAKRTGRVVPRELLIEAMEQVPRSVKILSPLADYFCELNNAPGKEIEILTEGEDWDTFKVQWFQTLAFVIGQKNVGAFSSRRLLPSSRAALGADSSPSEVETEAEAGDHLNGQKPGPGPVKSTSFRQKREVVDILQPTDVNHESHDEQVYGGYASIRKDLLSGPCALGNYQKDRQWLQDAIVSDMLRTAVLPNSGTSAKTGAGGDPWLVYIAGGMGVGKRTVLGELVKRGSLPLSDCVYVDPEAVRMYLPECDVLVDRYPDKLEALTRAEVCYITEMVVRSALLAKRNVMVSLDALDLDWYRTNVEQLQAEFASYRTAVLHVTADRDHVLRRSQELAMKNGRAVEEEVLDASREFAPRIVEVLAPMADYVCELRNDMDGVQNTDIVTKGETWDTFRSKWGQLQS